MASMRRAAKASAASARRGSAAAPAAATPDPPISSRRALGRYLGLFLLFAVVLFAVYQFSEATHRFRYVNAANAVICGRILGWVGVANQTTGTTVAIRTTNMEIISECSAIYVAILFTAGVLAFPTTWRARLRGLAFGAAVHLRDQRPASGIARHRHSASRRAAAAVPRVLVAGALRARRRRPLFVVDREVRAA
jgi:hypothetical protein